MSSDQQNTDDLSHALLAGRNPRCVRDDQQDWISSDELRRRVEILASSIAGVDNRLIFLFANNDLASLVGLLAAWAVRGTVSLIDPLLAADAQRSLVEKYQPEILLGASAVSGDYLEVKPAGADLPAFHALRAPTGSAVHPELRLLLSTSGSTGSPKFVRLSRTAVLTNARQIAEALAITSDDVGIAHLPLHYSYGMSIVTSHLVKGASVTLTSGKVTDTSFWRRIGEDGGSHFPGVPFHYSVLDRLGIARVAPASIKTFTQAGGQLDLQTRKRCYEAIDGRGGRFFIMYGQTEAGPRMTTLQHADFLRHSASVGQALSAGRLSILDDDGVAAATGVEGNVIYDGPNVMMGYAESRADLAAPDLFGGRLDTGDRGLLTGDGFLTLTGRNQRFAKVAGLRIALDDVEAALGASGSVAALARGETILLFAKASAAPDIAEKTRALARRLRLPSSSFVTTVVDELPINTNGKFDYRALGRLL